MGGEPLLRMAGIAKSFPGVQALRGVDFDGRPRRGARAAGRERCRQEHAAQDPGRRPAPDAGTITFDGAEVRLGSPHAAQLLGIVTIYQEFNLIPTLSVAENVFIGRLPVRAGGGSTGASCTGGPRALTAEVGLAVDPRRLVSDLSVAEQQMVEIARALSMEAKLVVMDEPTSALSDKEVQRLFAIVARAQGPRHLGRLRHPPARGGDADLRPGDRTARRRPWWARPRSPISMSSGSSA